MGSPLAAASAAPVVVIDGPPFNGSRRLRLIIAEPIVVATPFLSWRPVEIPGAIPTLVEIAEWQLVCAFGCKARASPTFQAQVACADRNLLTLQLTVAFWARYLTELVSSGLLASPLLCPRLCCLGVASDSTRSRFGVPVFGLAPLGSHPRSTPCSGVLFGPRAFWAVAPWL